MVYTLCFFSVLIWPYNSVLAIIHELFSAKNTPTNPHLRAKNCALTNFSTNTKLLSKRTENGVLDHDMTVVKMTLSGAQNLTINFDIGGWRSYIPKKCYTNYKQL